MRHIEFKKIEEKLLKKKSELTALVKKAKQETTLESEVGDQIDLATDSQLKELDYSLQDSEIETIQKIENTLEKLKTKKFGLCENCKKEIPLDRLKALPFSSYCIKCQKEADSLNPRRK